jgi:hypothetical protein
MTAFAPALLGLLLQAGQPLPAPPPEPANTVAEVVVTAPRSELIQSFIDDVSAPVSSTDQLGRWNGVICPGVTGARRRYAELLNDRLAMAAYRVGLDVGEPGCRPNIMVVVTDDGNRTAREIVQKNPLWMDKWGDEGSQGRRALKAFVETPRPVRWWHVSETVTADGFAVGRGESVEVRAVGRVRKNVRQDFNRLLIVVDMKKTGPVQFGALSDYVAMVALAQLDPNAKTDRFDTILNLFNAGERPTGLTAWDTAYLKGLYEARPDARNARVQAKDIGRSMREERPRNQ